MNIQDVGNYTGSVKTEQVNVQTQRSESPKILEQISAQQEQSEESRDEYVGSDMNIVENALYDIADIRQGKAIDPGASIRGGNYNPSGEKVSQKLVDIILSTGRKSLRIYRIE